MRHVVRRAVVCRLLVVVISLGFAAASTSGPADATQASAASAGESTSAVSAGESTMGYSNARLNWDDAEPGLAPTSVTAADFGKLFDTTLPATTANTPNQIYAQPLVADGMVITATEDNEVAGLTPTGSIAWHVSLGTPFTPASCGDLVPHIGVTSTPVYDPATDAVYVASKTASGSADGVYKLHALNPTTGAERPGWPVTITGKSSNGGQTFNPTTANQRPGLLLMDGSVYMGFASHCDHGPYVGYVIGADTSSRQLSIWSSESGLGTSEAGIWQSGGGLVSDGPGNILVTTGNGLSPVAGPGSTPPGNLAESVVRLKVDKYGAMSAVDFFSPANNAKLDQDDADLGSGGPIALPDDFGTPQHPHLLLQSGKDGVVRILDRDHLGGMGQGAGGTDDQLDSVQLNGLWGRFAAFSSSSGAHYVFSVPHSSPMQMLRITANSAGVPRISIVATSADSYAYTSGSPVVTSDGPDGSSATVWVVKCDSQTGTNAVLQAYALPSGSGTWTPLASFPLGTVAKFIQPATAGNRVYVGTRDGRVLAFGRPVQTALSAPSTEFGQAPVDPSTGVAQNVTVTVAEAVTVDKISASGPFSADPTGLLGTHAAGSSFDVPVTFTPTAAGAVSGALAITASTTGPDAEYDFGLHGTGTSPGLQATPGTLNFGDVNQGEGASLSMTVTNTGSDAETIDSITAPTASAFTVTDSPPDGMSLPSQASATITVQFAPTAVTDYADQLVVTGSAGSVTVPLSGTGIDGHPSMSLSTAKLSFGNVALGTSKTLSFVVTNTGNAVLTINKAAPPVLPFSVAHPVAEGLSLEPGDTATVQVTYAPTSAEPATDAYSITGNDGTGAQLVTVVGNNAPWTGAVSWSGGCIKLAGSATQLPASATSSPCAPVTVEQLSQNPRTHTLHLGATGSTTCLAVENTKAAGTSPVQFSTCSGSTAQVWQWRSDDSLYNSVSGKCLDVPGASTKSGTKLDVVRCAATSAQYWDVSGLQAARGAVSSGVAALNDICLDDRHSSRANDTAMQIYGCNRTGAQQITHVGSTLRVLGGCVDVRYAGTANHTLVQRYRCNGGVAQQWTTKADGALYNPHSKKCLDVPKGTTKPSTQVQIYTCNGTAPQRWTLPG